jgi:hypothetical protein
MAKSIADKVDVGAIVSPVAKEDLIMLDSVIKTIQCVPPTIVTDIYKLRRGRYKGVRIWSAMDLGTARMTDLFVTNHNYEPIPVDIVRIMFEEEPFTEVVDDDDFKETPVIEQEAGEEMPYVDGNTGEILDSEPMEEVEKRSKFEGLI